MGAFIDISGQKFNNLTVVSLFSMADGAIWNCICDCGKHCIVKGSRLKNGNKKNCGCIKQRTNFIDLTGHIYGKLTVTSLHIKGYGKMTKWNCLCECGKECTATTGNLRGGHTQSCGCMGSREAFKTRWITHGLCKRNKKLYDVWINMLSRCNNPENEAYPNYGGRGILVCEEWNDGFVFFDWAFANGYKEGLVFDRRENDGNYTSENCRFITDEESKQNTTKTTDIKTVIAIKKLLKEGIKPSKLALMFNVDNSVVSNIKRGKTYSNIIV